MSDLAGGDKAADDDLAVAFEVPDNSLTERIAFTPDDGVPRHDHHLPFERNHILQAPHFVAGAVPVSDVAAGNPGRALHRLEPLPYRIRHISILPVVPAVAVLYRSAEGEA